MTPYAKPSVLYYQLSASNFQHHTLESSLQNVISILLLRHKLGKLAECRDLCKSVKLQFSLRNHPLGIFLRAQSSGLRGRASGVSLVPGFGWWPLTSVLCSSFSLQQFRTHLAGLYWTQLIRIVKHVGQALGKVFAGEKPHLLFKISNWKFEKQVVLDGCVERDSSDGMTLVA